LVFGIVLTNVRKIVYVDFYNKTKYEEKKTPINLRYIGVLLFNVIF